MELLKQAAIADHLPTLRLPDTVAGALVGGGAGLLADRLLRPPGKRSPARAALIGAGLGAAGGNLAGDRLRRYASNKVLPFGYGDPVGQLAPKGVGDVWSALVKDEPAYDPALEAGFRAKDPDLHDAALATRRELFRRQLGVHSDRGASDYWAKNPDGSYSLNPDNPGIGPFVDKLLLGKHDPDLDPAKVTSWLGAADDANRGAVLRSLMGPVVGGQHVAVERLADRPGVRLGVDDVWDTNLNAGDKTFLRTALGKVFSPGWWGKTYSPADGEVDYAGREPAATNAATVRSLLARAALDKVLAAENPRVTQRVDVGYNGPGVPAAVAPATGGGRSYGGQ